MGAWGTQALYLSLGELQLRFDNQYTFGTGTSCWASLDFGSFCVQRATAAIDNTLQMWYGTYNPLFGTNSIGTTDVPELIKDCCADLSMAYAFNFKQLSLSPNEQKWGKNLYDSAMGTQLDILSNPVNTIQPFSGTKISYSIETPGAYKQVRGELITLMGTNIVPLSYRNVIADTVKVYGTFMVGTGTRVYIRDSDYKVWGYDTDFQGTVMGALSGIGTMGTIPVYVDYKYRLPATFTLNDNYKWGSPYPERRG